MTSALPRIAIPEPTSTDLAYNQRSLPQYIRAIEAAGGIAVPIPLHASSAAQAGLLASCAAILLPGSPADLDPARYGQETAKESAPKDVPREAADDLLLRHAFERGKPVFGICYGLQSSTCVAARPAPRPASSRVGRTAKVAVDHEPGRGGAEGPLR